MPKPIVLAMVKIDHVVAVIRLKRVQTAIVRKKKRRVVVGSEVDVAPTRMTGKRRFLAAIRKGVVIVGRTRVALDVAILEKTVTAAG
jgi:hypothetical protein